MFFNVPERAASATNRYLFLIRKIKNPQKFRLIDMKQATDPAAIGFVRTTATALGHPGGKVVSIQKRMQYTSPAQLSVLVYRDQAYVMQQFTARER